MTFQNATQAFEHFYHVINNGGEPFDDTKAIFNTSFCIADPFQSEINTRWRKFSKDYAQLEWEWFMSGNRSVEEIKKHAAIWDKMHGGDNLVWSNYGWWWRYGNQLEEIVKMIKLNYKTRKAIIVHYNPELVTNFKHDTPCNIALNFWIQDGKLNLTVFSRSTDLWYGFCNDQFQFANLLAYVSAELGSYLEIGSLHFFITNFHLYNNKLNKHK